MFYQSLSLYSRLSYNTLNCLHAEEIKAMSAMFEAEQTKRAAECSSLHDKLLSAEQRQEDLRITLEASSSQMTSIQQQEQQVRQQLADSQALHAELAGSKAALQTRCSALEAQLASTQSDSSKSQNQATQPDSAAVLQLLEQQLVSLSHMLREKEQQIGALQETVQQQCDERTLMHIKYMQLQSAHQTASLGAASGNSPVQTIGTSSLVAQTGSASDGSVSQSTLLSSQMSAGKHVSEKEAPAQSRGKLNRLASASEQQHGKSGLLGRIMATSSKTGRAV